MQHPECLTAPDGVYRLSTPGGPDGSEWAAVTVIGGNVFNLEKDDDVREDGGRDG